MVSNPTQGVESGTLLTFSARMIGRAHDATIAIPAWFNYRTDWDPRFPANPVGTILDIWRQNFRIIGRLTA